MNVLSWNEPQIFAFFYVFVRVASLLLFFPLFGDQTVPGNVKIFLSIAFALVCFPVMWGDGFRVGPAMYTSTNVILWAIAQEVALGAGLGFVARWIFDACHFSGQIAGTAMGLSMASVLDPNNDGQTLAIAQLRHILCMLLFLAMDGHHILLHVITESFRIVPIGGANWFNKEADVLKFLTTMTAEMIVLAIKLAAPVVVVVFVINVTFGLVSRAVPQMNVFAVSFGANIMVGLFVLIVSVPSFTGIMQGLFEGYSGELIKFLELVR